MSEGAWTPFGRLMGWMEAIEWTPLFGWLPLLLVSLMIGLGLLMVSRVPYAHLMSALARDRSQFFTLVGIVFGLFLFFLAPVPGLFLVFNGFVLYGLVRYLVGHRRAARERRAVGTG